jgi:putative ATP-binding cassette transporter
VHYHRLKTRLDSSGWWLLFRLGGLFPAAVLWSMLVGLAGGISSVLFLSLVNRALQTSAVIPPHLLTQYLCLAGFLLLNFPLSQALGGKFAQLIARTLRRRLIAQILKTSLVEIEKIGPAKLVSLLVEDVGALATALLLLPAFLVNLFTLTAALVYCFLLSPPVCGLVILLLAVALVIYFLLNRPALRYFAAARESDQVTFQHLSAMVYGIKDLKASVSKQAYFHWAVFDPQARRASEAYLKGQFTAAFASTSLQSLIYLIPFLLIFILPAWLSLAPGVSIRIIITLLYVAGPVSAILGVMPLASRVGVCLRGLRSMNIILSDPSAEPSANLSAPVAKRPEAIQLFNASVNYPGPSPTESFTFGPINLSFRPGEIVFIAGSNGSGKTTFLKLLSGLYPTESGGSFTARPVKCRCNAHLRNSPPLSVWKSFMTKGTTVSSSRSWISTDSPLLFQMARFSVQPL